MKKIFIINCNAKKHSKKEAYVQTFTEEARNSGHEVRTINVYDLDVDYLRANGDEFDYALSPELKEAQDNIIWANLLVFVYPIWCLAIPPILSTFISKTFAEGVACQYSSMGPKPLMRDKKAVIMQSYSMPYFAMKYLYNDVPLKWWNVMLTQWCGPKIIKRFDFDLIDNVPEKRSQKWINQIRTFVKKI